MAEYVVPPPRRWTVKEVYNLPPDGMRHEVVHGEHLVTPAPSPNHQGVVARLMLVLGPYLKDLGLAHTLYTGPVDYFHRSDIYVQPDLVVCHPDEVTNDWRDMRRPRLVVEVLSPSSVRGDRTVKRPAYQAAGVEQYWIADPAAGLLEVWTPADAEPRICSGQLAWRVHPEAPELLISIPELFEGLPS